MTEIIDIHRVFAMHIAQEKPIRAIAYALSRKLEDGHICIDPETYNESLNQDAGSPFLEYNPFLSERGHLDITAFKDSSLVTGDGSVRKPFVLANGMIYLQRYFHYETEILEGIRRLVERPVDKVDLSGHNRFIGNMFSGAVDPGHDEVDWQMVAALRAMLTHFLIITGGPGTGKTTTVAKVLVLAYLANPDVRVALAAPTGKAAARLNESIARALQLIPDLPAAIRGRIESIQASTIHRLLGARMNSPFFRYNKQNPLKEDLLIVDESSMVDAALMAKLITALHADASLILLGDKDQLASVEAGSIFGDLCLTRSGTQHIFSKNTTEFINEFIPEGQPKLGSGKVQDDKPNLLSGQIVELSKSFRFRSAESIGRVSKSIIRGDLHGLDLQYEDIKQGVVVVSDFDSDSIPMNREFLGEIGHFKSYITEPDIRLAIGKINTVRILCALNHGKYGVGYFNDLIETYLKQEGLIDPPGEYYHNRPVLVTLNDYALGLFNGDVGIIRMDEQGEPRAYFEGLDEEGKQILRSFPAAYISGLKTVFAMTIHKSQGSEFDRVVMVLPDKEQMPILTRELLYTGITRARSHCLIIGNEEVIRAAAQRSVSRASGIRERINQISQPR